MRSSTPPHSATANAASSPPLDQPSTTTNTRESLYDRSPCDFSVLTCYFSLSRTYPVAPRPPRLTPPHPTISKTASSSQPTNSPPRSTASHCTMSCCALHHCCLLHLFLAHPPTRCGASHRHQLRATGAVLPIFHQRRFASGFRNPYLDLAARRLLLKQSKVCMQLPVPCVDTASLTRTYRSLSTAIFYQESIYCTARLSNHASKALSQ